MVKRKKKNIKCCLGCRIPRTLITCWWECKLTYYSGKLLASIYPNGINAPPKSQQFHSKIYNLHNSLKLKTTHQMSIKSRKDQKKKYINTMKYYRAMKMNTLQLLAIIHMILTNKKLC